MTTKQLQTNISSMDAPELQEIIVTLFKKSKECKALMGVYFNQTDITAEFDNVSGKIERCFRRNGVPMMRDPKLREAKKYISDFKKIFTNQPKKILELNLLYCFYLAEFLSEFGGGMTAWEDSLINVFADCCDTVKTEGLEELYLPEIKRINKTLNRNYCELLEDTITEYFS